jgi:CSLREA domain-containing protein
MIRKGVVGLWVLLVFGGCSGGGGGDEDVRGEPRSDVGAIDAVTGVMIGPEGGTISMNGVTVVVPTDALAVPTAISVLPATASPTAITLAGPVFEFLPHGLEFAVPVTVTVPFDSGTEAADVLQLFWGDSSDGAWAALPTTVSLADGTATATTTHFSWGGAGTSNLECTGQFVVNSNGDEPDLDLSNAGCDTDAEMDGDQCTLRAAIEQANLCPGKDVVTFAMAEGMLKPASRLPAIKDALVLNGTDQPPFGEVTLSGSKAGDAEGLLIYTGNVRVSSFNITGFSRDGIRAKNGPEDIIYLDSVDLNANCGWGVRSAGIVRVNMDTVTANPGQLSEINENGIGEGCSGGGILAFAGEVYAANVWIEDNNGPGIATLDGVNIMSCDISNNLGDGIYIHTGGVEVYYNKDASDEPVEISNNFGHGVSASGACGDDEAGCMGFSSLHGLSVSGNSGWGLKVGGGLSISYANTYLPRRSTFFGNGFGQGCRVAVDGAMDADFHYEAGPCSGGGIMQWGDGIATIYSSAIYDNAGPGILAHGHMVGGGLQVTGNGADGIRTETGGIHIRNIDLEGYEAKFSHNAGHGLASMGVTDIEIEMPAGVSLETDSLIEGNGRCAIASRQTVLVGRVDNGGTFPRLTTMQLNGTGHEACSVWRLLGVKDELPTISSAPCEGGGIVVAQGGAWVNHTDIFDNGGPGVLAKGDVQLEQVNIANNKGQGAASTSSCVKVAAGKACDISSNQGIGLKGVAECASNSGGAVSLEATVTVDGNWGIGIDFHSASLDMGTFGGNPLPQGSSVSGNGKGDECWDWSILTNDADIEPATAACGGGGIVGHEAGSDVVATGTAIRYNAGDGIQVEGKVSMTDVVVEENEGWGVSCVGDFSGTGGKVCNNSSGNLDTATEPELVGVELCGDIGALCDSFYPCNDNLNCEKDWVVGKAYCTMPGCIGVNEVCYSPSAPGSDACCFGYSCEQIYADQALCTCVVADEACDKPEQCCSGHCNNGVCQLQSIGGPCVTDYGCEMSLACEDGKCQDCAGPKGWCSDGCCPDMECHETKLMCCRVAGKACFENKDCCSDQCVLFECL